MRNRQLLVCMILAAAVTLTATAQDAQGPKFQLQTFKVAPSQIEQFDEAVKGLVAASSAIDLDAKFGWWTWMDDFNYIIVSPLESMGAFDDPNYWISEFDGTPSMETVQSTMAKFGSMEMQYVSNDVWQMVPEWSHEPEGAPEAAGAIKYDLTIAPGKGEAFNKLVPQFVAAWGEMNYPYNLRGYRSIMGDVSKVSFVLTYDDQGNYYSENTITKVAERAGMSDRINKLRADLRQVIDDIDVDEAAYRPDLSYTGPETMTAAEE